MKFYKKGEVLMYEESRGNGYVGFSRSVNSQSAIECYELPISKYTKKCGCLL